MRFVMLPGWKTSRARRMSERTTVEDLVDQAETLLWELAADQTSVPGQIVNGWHQFYAGAGYYLAMSGRGTHGQAEAVRDPLRPPDYPAIKLEGPADGRLTRAGALLGAAGEVIAVSRDAGGDGAQISRSPEAQNPALNRATSALADGAHIATRAAWVLQGRARGAGEPRGDLLAARLTEHLAAVEIFALSLASSGPHVGPMDALSVPGPPGDDEAGHLLGAVRAWREHNRRLADGHALSSRELHRHAAVAGMLADVIGRLTHSPETEQARHDWIRVGQRWQVGISGHAIDEAAVALAQQVHSRAVALDRQPANAARLRPVLAEITGHITEVAVRHHDLAARMAETERLYAPARRDGLRIDGPDWEQRLNDRLRGRWTPLTASEVTPLLVAYQAAARSTQELHATLEGGTGDRARRAGALAPFVPAHRGVDGQAEAARARTAAPEQRPGHVR